MAPLETSTISILVSASTAAAGVFTWFAAQYFNKRKIDLNFQEEVRNSYESLLVAYKDEIVRLREQIEILQMRLKMLEDELHKKI